MNNLLLDLGRDDDQQDKKRKGRGTSGWVKDFVTSLGQSADERDPNSKLRVTLPSSHSATKLGR